MSKIWTQEELIKYYEKRLSDVKKMHNPDNFDGAILKERCQDYITYAEKQLEAVKNGRTW